MFSKLVFSKVMTARIMELFLEEVRAGAMKDTKWSYHGLDTVSNE
jgi:hypothetical protein